MIAPPPLLPSLGPERTLTGAVPPLSTLEVIVLDVPSALS